MDFTEQDIDTVTASAVETLLWSEALDDGPAGMSPEAVAQIREVVSDFLTDEWISDALAVYLAARPLDHIGHDFILTANHHGAGFWDRGLGEAGDTLTGAALGYSFEAYVGDDGLVYVQ